MRTPHFVANALVLVAIASSSLLRAQFRQPTADELKMTADPKAPGAAAVYLDIEEVTDDPLHYQSFYARIKVLQEKGKELATVGVPYLRGNSRISDIKARTIHADGTVIPLVGKPEDLLITRTTSGKGDQLQIDRRVFTLPSVEVGSILEYRFQIDYKDDEYSSPTWDIQRPYFVHKAHYAFTPFKEFLPGSQNATAKYLLDKQGRVLDNLVWLSRLPQGVSVIADVVGHYGLDITDVPPIPSEEWMPPIRSFLYSVFFYYKNAPSAKEFWNTEARRWSKDVDHFAEPSKAIREAVKGLISPGDSDLDKATKLYKAAQGLDNTDFSRKKSESEMKLLKLKVARRAEDTWSHKSGSSQDIALLYLAMLRAAGLSAYDMKVVDRQKGLFDPGYLDFDQLDDDIIILNIGGKDIFLDPGEKMCPFQTLHWRHSGASGIRQSSEGRAIMSTPLSPFNENNLVRTGSITLDDHGSIDGNFRFVMTGQDALRWRQDAFENDLDQVRKQFDSWLESMVPAGVEAHIDHFLGLDDSDGNLLAIVKVHGTIGSATSKRVFLPGFFFETRSHHPFIDEEKRIEPVDMHYPGQVSDQIVYHLPANLTIEGAPQDTTIPWADHAVLTTGTVSAPGQITITRSLVRAFTFARQEEYQNLRGFYQKVAASDQGQLVLTTAGPAAKGN